VTELEGGLPDLGFALCQKVKKSGYWDPRVEDHSFRIALNPYIVSSREFNQLEQIGSIVYKAYNNLDNELSMQASNQEIIRLKSLLNTGIDRRFRNVQYLRPQMPRIMKVDLVKDADDRFWVVEVDSVSKHGWGLTVLMNKELADHDKLRGICSVLIDWINGHKNESTLISASHEHFYLPEFKILQETLGRNGYFLRVKEEPILAPEITKAVIDIPSLYRSESKELELMLEAYRNGEMDCFLPPKPYLSSKLTLLAAMERSASLREKVPAMKRINKQFASEDYWDKFTQENGADHVLKRVVSSGSREIAFSYDKGWFTRLEKACNNPGNYLLQEAINSKEETFDWIDQDGAIRLADENYHCRYTAYYSDGELIDLRVIANQSMIVHGAVDSIQLPTTV